MINLKTKITLRKILEDEGNPIAYESKTKSDGSVEVTITDPKYKGYKFTGRVRGILDGKMGKWKNLQKKSKLSKGVRE